MPACRKTTSLTATRISKDWWLGRTGQGVYFGTSLAEVAEKVERAEGPLVLNSDQARVVMVKRRRDQQRAHLVRAERDALTRRARACAAAYEEIAEDTRSAA